MRLLQWWLQRETRERYLLAFGIGFVIVLALYLALEPSIIERNRMRDEIPQLQDDLVWMQSHVEELRAAMDITDSDMESGNNTLSLARVQDVVKDLALQEAVNELSPVTNSSIRLNFTDISYPDLMDLMYQLRNKTGAGIQRAQISRNQNKPGIVQASLILGR